MENKNSNIFPGQTKTRRLIFSTPKTPYVSLQQPVVANRIVIRNHPHLHGHNLSATAINFNLQRVINASPARIFNSRPVSVSSSVVYPARTSLLNTPVSKIIVRQSSPLNRSCSNLSDMIHQYISAPATQAKKQKVQNSLENTTTTVFSGCEQDLKKSSLKCSAVNQITKDTAITEHAQKLQKLQQLNGLLTGNYQILYKQFFQLKKQIKQTEFINEPIFTNKVKGHIQNIFTLQTTAALRKINEAEVDKKKIKKVTAVKHHVKHQEKPQFSIHLSRSKYEEKQNKSMKDSVIYKMKQLIGTSNT